MTVGTQEGHGLAGQATPQNPLRTPKPWGYEELLVHGPYALKRLHIRASRRLSLQFHERKIETLMVANGTAEITLEGAVHRYGPGDVVHVPAGAVHRIAAVEGDVDLFEVSTPELGDLVRLEDDYGRAGQT
jgi:mannose-6-phosphate isomerase